MNPIDGIIWSDDLQIAAEYCDMWKEAVENLGRATAIITMLLADNTPPTTRRIALNFINDMRSAPHND